MTMNSTQAPALPLDLSEHGRAAEPGALARLEPWVAWPGCGPARLDRRLFFQLLVLTGCTSTTPLLDALSTHGIEGVLYQDLHDPRGVGFAPGARHQRPIIKPVQPCCRDRCRLHGQAPVAAY